MLAEVILEPPGAEAEAVLAAWLEGRQLAVGAGGLVELAPEDCLGALVDLRARCYDLGLTVNANFSGGKE